MSELGGTGNGAQHERPAASNYRNAVLFRPHLAVGLMFQVPSYYYFSVSIYFWSCSIPPPPNVILCSDALCRHHHSASPPTHAMPQPLALAAKLNSSVNHCFVVTPLRCNLFANLHLKVSNPAGQFFIAISFHAQASPKSASSRWQSSCSIVRRLCEWIAAGSFACCHRPPS